MSQKPRFPKSRLYGHYPTHGLGNKSSWLVEFRDDHFYEILYSPYRVVGRGRAESGPPYQTALGLKFEEVRRWPPEFGATTGSRQEDQF